MSRAEQLIADGLDPVQAHRVARQEAEIRRQTEARRAALADANRASYATLLDGEERMRAEA